jgi:hypothetical protein
VKDKKIIKLDENSWIADDYDGDIETSIEIFGPCQYGPGWVDGSCWINPTQAREMAKALNEMADHIENTYGG